MASGNLLQYAEAKAIEDVTRYVVSKLVVGDFNAVMALEEYFVKGRSPAEIARTIGVSRSTIKGWIHRIYEKTMNPAKSPDIFKRVIEALRAVGVPVFVTSYAPHLKKCLLCGEILFDHEVRRHMLREHRDVIEYYVEQVLKAVQ